jgi:EEF1A lysine methyltransferase 4
VSIDFSTKAIAIMAERESALNLEWQVMDVRDLKFPGNSFDIAIDKGTLDAMLHGSLWDPEDDAKENTKAYVDEVSSGFIPMASHY